jgi:hypothetical protein
VTTWYARLKADFDHGGAMTTNREQQQRGARRRAPRRDAQDGLDRRRAEMQAAEGHAGSIPRGNQRAEDENVGHRRGEWDRLLGH